MSFEKPAIYYFAFWKLIRNHSNQRRMNELKSKWQQNIACFRDYMDAKQ